MSRGAGSGVKERLIYCALSLYAQNGENTGPAFATMQNVETTAGEKSRTISRNVRFVRFLLGKYFRLR